MLEEAGLVKVEKGYEGRRARRWVAATRRGRAALAAEVNSSRELISRVDGAAWSGRCSVRRDGGGGGLT
jgi:DNA-binding PadR family transcriptional regulator